MLNTFLQWLKLNKNSPKTIASYFQQVNCFGKWCNYEFNQESLNKYLIKLKDENKSINTINLFKNAFIGYCTYANLSVEIPSPKAVKRQGIKFYFTEKDLQMVLKNQYDEMDLILRFMFYTGARPSEIINLKIDHINFESKDIRFYNAKGNKDRVIPFINNKLYEDLKLHCNRLARENVFGVSYQTLQRTFKAIKEDMNIKSHEVVEPRTMRISFAKHCLSLGMDISYLKKLMGHSDISITEIYAEPDERMIKEFCEKIRKEK